MAIKYKQKKFGREHSKSSQRTKDRIVKRYLKSEQIAARAKTFWGEIDRVRGLRRERAGA